MMLLFGVVITLVLLFFVSILRLFMGRFVQRPFSQVIPFLRFDDSRVLAELLDSRLERQFAHALTHKHFRIEQLNRIRLMHERLQCRSHNVMVWQEWGECELGKARVSGDEELKAAADDLVVACAEFRIGASSVQMQLRLWQLKLMAWPLSRIPRLSGLRRVDDFDLLESYEHIKQSALNLAQVCGGNCWERLAAVL
jgi:hypothetical protein